jgi:chemotaxis protein MotB
MTPRVRRRGAAGSGAPAWMVTFGDMMALLLCFFVLLQAFSELKDEQQYTRVVRAIQEAFGYSGEAGRMPIEDAPLQSLIQKLETAASNHAQGTAAQGAAVTEGIDGPFVKVTRMTDGIIFTLGGPNMFEHLSATVSAPGRLELERLAAVLAGRNNRIIIRGHAAAIHLPSDGEWRHLDDLSYARAAAVRDILVPLGVSDDALRLEAVGDREPAEARAHTATDIALNRRVDIVLTEEAAADMTIETIGPSPLVLGGDDQ